MVGLGAMAASAAREEEAAGAAVENTRKRCSRRHRFPQWHSIVTASHRQCHSNTVLSLRMALLGRLSARRHSRCMSV